MDIKEKTILGENFTFSRKIIAFLAILIIYFFYCYNFMVGTFVRPTMVNEFGFTLKQASSIFAIMSFGTIPGTILSGMSATKFGKKRTLMGIAILFSLMTLVPLFQPTNYTLWRVARFAAGVALGGVFGTAIPLITELFPQKYRGKLAAICTSTFSIAMIFAGQFYAFLGDSNWRLLILTAAIPPLIGVIATFFLVPDDYEYMKSLKEKGKKENVKINYLEMYKGKYLFIGIGVILLSGMNFIVYAGYSNNATNYLISTLGFSAPIAGSIYSIQGIGQLIGYNFWGYISDKFGRKYPVIGMMSVSIIIFIFSRVTGGDSKVFFVLSFLLGISFGFSGAWGAYYTELFPEKFRALSPGISFNGGRIISSIGLPLVAGVASTSWGMNGLFIVLIIGSLIGSGIWLLLPETLIREKKSDIIFNKNNIKE